MRAEAALVTSSGRNRLQGGSVAAGNNRLSARVPVGEPASVPVASEGGENPGATAKGKKPCMSGMGSAYVPVRAG